MLSWESIEVTIFRGQRWCTSSPPIAHTFCMNAHLMFKWHWIDRVNYLHSACMVPVCSWCKGRHPAAPRVPYSRCSFSCMPCSALFTSSVAFMAVQSAWMSKCVNAHTTYNLSPMDCGNKKFTQQAQLCCILYKYSLLSFTVYWPTSCILRRSLSFL